MSRSLVKGNRLCKTSVVNREKVNVILPPQLDLHACSFPPNKSQIENNIFPLTISQIFQININIFV